MEESFRETVLRTLGSTVGGGGILLGAIVNLLGLILPFYNVAYGLLYLAFLVLLATLPLGEMGTLTTVCMRWAIQRAGEYFRVKVIMEDESALDPSRPYIVGYEPHSVIPVGLPLVFHDLSEKRPKGITRCRNFASSICFYAPVIRHLFWWLGTRAVSKSNIIKHLDAGISCVIIPGGVREIQFMEHGSETVFLRQRLGFVNLAIQQGVPIVPAFGFGQTDAYSWTRPDAALFSTGLTNWISRRIGFQMMLAFWGRWGTPVPHRRRVTVVVGKPIVVKQENNPSKETVQQYLTTYIKSLEELFEKHKRDAGYPDLKLRIL